MDFLETLKYIELGVGFCSGLLLSFVFRFTLTKLRKPKLLSMPRPSRTPYNSSQFRK